MYNKSSIMILATNILCCVQLVLCIIKINTCSCYVMNSPYLISALHKKTVPISTWLWSRMNKIKFKCNRWDCSIWLNSEWTPCSMKSRWACSLFFCSVLLFLLHFSFALTQSYCIWNHLTLLTGNSEMVLCIVE